MIMVAYYDQHKKMLAFKALIVYDLSIQTIDWLDVDLQKITQKCQITWYTGGQLIDLLLQIIFSLNSDFSLL